MRDLTGKGQGEESMLGSPTQSTLSDRMDGHRPLSLRLADVWRLAGPPPHDLFD